ncbi:SRPBCC family protein [Kitasatospora gansuensis]
MNGPDRIARLRVLAAGLRAPLYAERRLDLPFEQVWAVVADLEGELPHLIPFVREFRVPAGDSELKQARAVDTLGFRGRFEVRLGPGWCLMQSRLVTMGMAAESEGKAPGSRSAARSGRPPSGRCSAGTDV